LRPPEYGRSKEPEAYLKFYLEIGAGIDQLIRHLFALPLRRGDRYLEVGCGFGFALDFGRHTFGLDVLGIDPSPFAAAGHKALGLPMISGYLTSETKLPVNSFDIVVASEVIEHIFEPLEFVRVIRDRLGPDGVFILTTPNGLKAVPETPSAALNALLSVGWHYILYSPKALDRLLREAGFRHAEVAVRGHTLIAAATDGSTRVDLNAEVDRRLLRAYLDERRKTTTDPALAHGMGYRLLMDLTNDAQYERALEVYGDLHRLFLAEYAIDIDTPHSSWLRHAAKESFRSFAARFPMCLCGVAHLRGLLALNAEGRPDVATHFFSLSVRHGELVRELLQTIGSDDAQTEVFVERSRTLYLRALAYASPKEAAEQASKLLQNNSSRTLSYPAQQDDLLEILPHLVNLGALEAAEEMAPIAEEVLLGRTISEHTRRHVGLALERIKHAAEQTRQLQSPQTNAISLGPITPLSRLKLWLRGR
jgi:SAM-dependent methyltransferase